MSIITENLLTIFWYVLSSIFDWFRCIYIARACSHYARHSLPLSLRGTLSVTASPNGDASAVIFLLPDTCSLVNSLGKFLGTIFCPLLKVDNHFSMSFKHVSQFCWMEDPWLIHSILSILNVLLHFLLAKCCCQSLMIISIFFC